ncbi:benzoate 1,2-dioxygenase small subunit [Chryseobacterium sp.]|uniref:benzoate 1,2-dioxygenase small subunit n=1 Tax=Chryseobacterium sp. TaxID=1871047 RepID=UPI0025BE8704|nr:benzoate 1,2-dioxygenase small subunit [Chryseobacterium sp.]
MTEYNKILAFLYKEARLLDDREWDEWLTLYHEDVEYWMPSWTDEDRITTDPLTEISLIYYTNRGGLEDRVFRIKTERSGASMPEPRTSHNITNVEITEENNTEIKLRFNWLTKSFRYKTTDTYFGTSYYTLNKTGDSFVITNKKVVIKNDYIRQVLDIYHI